jgi:hypothetical protein
MAIGFDSSWFPSTILSIQIIIKMVSTLTASLEFPEVTFIEQDKVQFTYFSSQKKVHFHHDIYIYIHLFGCDKGSTS